MGAIGARIYEDDIALDLRGDFRDYYYASTPVTEIEDTLLDDYLNDDDRYDDVVWLALCCAELETGTLTDRVKTKALDRKAHV